MVELQPQIAMDRCPYCGGQPILTPEQLITCRECGVELDLTYGVSMFPLGRIAVGSDNAHKYENYTEILNLRGGTFIDRFRRSARKYHKKEERLIMTQKRFCGIGNIGTPYRINNIIGMIVPEYRVDAMYLYRKLLKMGPMRNHVVAAAVCVYAVDKKTRFPLGIQTIVRRFRDRGHGITSHLICEALLRYNITVKPWSVADYIDALSGRLQTPVFESRLTKYGLDGGYIQMLSVQAQRLNVFIQKKTKHCRNPRHVAIALLYAADWYLYKKNITPKRMLNQQILGEIMGISSYTIRDLYAKDIKPLFKTGGDKSCVK